MRPLSLSSCVPSATHALPKASSFVDGAAILVSRPLYLMLYRVNLETIRAQRPHQVECHVHVAARATLRRSGSVDAAVFRWAPPRLTDAHPVPYKYFASYVGRVIQQ